MTSIAEAGASVPGLQRGLAILESLAQDPEAGTAGELSERLGIPIASVYRITSSLDELGYLVRDSDTKRLRITSKFLLLGQPQGSNRSLAACSVPSMINVRDATGETTQLCSRVDTEIVILDQLLSVHSFKYSAELGARCPIYSCAPGKAMMAFLPEGHLQTVVSKIRFKRFTGTTITSKRTFLAELKEVRENGFAVDRAEGMEGIHCVAAPILDRHGYAIAGITICGPSSRVPEDEFQIIGNVVKAAAADISKEFSR